MTLAQLPHQWRYMHAPAQHNLAHEVGRLFLEGRDTAQMAHELGYPEGTIYSALHHWRERRRQQS